MLRLATLCSLALFACTAHAEVEVLPLEHEDQGLVLVARVTEQIAPGDYEALLKGIMAHPGKYARKLLILDNIGGSAPEAACGLRPRCAITLRRAPRPADNLW